MKDILNILKQRFNAGDDEIHNERLAFIDIPSKKLVETVTYLKDLKNYRHLVLLTAVDWIEEGKFQLTYLLNNPVDKVDLGLRVRIDREPAEMEGIHHLWPHAVTYQRELREMFGIIFPGSPGLYDDFILEGWDQIPPYRRDFDTLKYAQETYFPRPGRFTHDPAEYMREKLYPGEDK